jgi:phosphotransferase system  glucose/maltose/N-acetylglucosamine-specific IIC component
MILVNKEILSESLNSINYLICFVIDSSNNEWDIIISKIFFKESITNVQTINSLTKVIEFDEDFKNRVKDDCEIKLLDYKFVSNNLETGLLFFITNKNIIEIIYNKALNSSEETGLIFFKENYLVPVKKTLTLFHIQINYKIIDEHENLLNFYYANKN